MTTATARSAYAGLHRNVHTERVTVSSDEHDRLTPTVDLANLALDFEETEAARTGEVRALVSPSMLPRLAVTIDQLRDLPIDPRTAFLVSLVDGQCSVGMIGHIAGMPSDEAIGIFAMLLQLGAVELRDPR
jgi:hypothetical protein